MTKRRSAFLGSLWFIALAGCTSGTLSDAQVAQALGQELAHACPLSGADDETARGRCAEALTNSALLRDRMAHPFLWGQQQAPSVVNPDGSVTRFEPLVWRRMYLSLYSFPKTFTVESTPEGDTLLRIEASFRNQLDMGSYPYPFWHRESKWLAYQYSRELLFVIRRGSVVAALRSANEDVGRTVVPHKWNGQWEWKRSGQVMPFVTLYTHLFSPNNPYVKNLDSAFRALQEGMRPYACTACHSPDNQGMMEQLDFFNYPNQSLAARHRIVRSLETNTMPRGDTQRGIPQGIQDARERSRLLALAKAFAEVADQALAFEGESTPKQ